MGVDFYYLLGFFAFGMVANLFYRLYQFGKKGGDVVYSFQADKRQRMILGGLFAALTAFYFYYEIVNLGSGWNEVSKILPFWALWWVYFSVFITQTPKLRERGIQAATTYFEYEKVHSMKMEPGRKAGHSRLHIVAETNKGRRRDVYLSVVGDQAKVEAELRKFGFLKSKKNKKKSK